MLYNSMSIKVGGRRDWGRGCAVEIPQLKIVPIVSRFKRLFCLFLSIMIVVRGPDPRCFGKW